MYGSRMAISWSRSIDSCPKPRRLEGMNTITHAYTSFWDYCSCARLCCLSVSRFVLAISISQDRAEEEFKSNPSMKRGRAPRSLCHQLAGLLGCLTFRRVGIPKWCGSPLDTLWMVLVCSELIVTGTLT